MSRPPSAIRNVGPKMEAAFIAAGFPTAEAIEAAGADAAYRALLAGGMRPHFIGYYALVMGLQGRPWNDCQGAEKDALRARFDAICASLTEREKGRLDLEAALDEIGVVARKTRR